jgi:hypothetical protein
MQTEMLSPSRPLIITIITSSIAFQLLLNNMAGFIKQLLEFSLKAFLRFATYPSVLQQTSYAYDNQKGFIKLSKRLITTYLIIFFAFSSVAGLFLFNPFGTKETQAAWFNDNWAYRHQVTFTHNADVSADRKIQFTLDTAELISASLMQTNCNDVRFTDPSGKVLAWDLTGTCNNASTTYEVIFPKVFNGKHRNRLNQLH